MGLYVPAGQSEWLSLHSHGFAGRRKFQGHSATGDLADMMRSPRNQQREWKCEQGTRETRFYLGFQRRMKEAIAVERERHAFEAAKAARQADQFRARQEALANTGNLARLGRINILPWPCNVLPRQRKHYHMPAAKSPRDIGDPRDGMGPRRRLPEHRKDRMRREGMVLRDKHSSLLGTGRCDIKSYGARDNFALSFYHAQSAVKMIHRRSLEMEALPGKGKMLTDQALEAAAEARPLQPLPVDSRAFCELDVNNDGDLDADELAEPQIATSGRPLTIPLERPVRPAAAAPPPVAAAPSPRRRVKVRSGL
eukprot:g1362.t1